MAWVCDHSNTSAATSPPTRFVAAAQATASLLSDAGMTARLLLPPPFSAAAACSAGRAASHELAMSIACRWLCASAPLLLLPPIHVAPRGLVTSRQALGHPVDHAYTPRESLPKEVAAYLDALAPPPSPSLPQPIPPIQAPTPQAKLPSPPATSAAAAHSNRAPEGGHWRASAPSSPGGVSSSLGRGPASVALPNPAMAAVALVAAAAAGQQPPAQQPSAEQPPSQQRPAQTTTVEVPLRAEGAAPPPFQSAAMIPTEERRDEAMLSMMKTQLDPEIRGKIFAFHPAAAALASSSERLGAQPQTLTSYDAFIARTTAALGRLSFMPPRLDSCRRVAVIVEPRASPAMVARTACALPPPLPAACLAAARFRLGSVTARCVSACCTAMWL